MDIVLEYVTGIIATTVIQKAQKSARRTQVLVARKLDPREEGYEIPYLEQDEYALRDSLSRD